MKSREPAKEQVLELPSEPFQHKSDQDKQKKNDEQSSNWSIGRNPLDDFHVLILHGQDVSNIGDGLTQLAVEITGRDRRRESKVCDSVQVGELNDRGCCCKGHTPSVSQAIEGAGSLEDTTWKTTQTMQNWVVGSRHESEWMKTGLAMCGLHASIHNGSWYRERQGTGSSQTQLGGSSQCHLRAESWDVLAVLITSDMGSKGGTGENRNWEKRRLHTKAEWEWDGVGERWGRSTCWQCVSGTNLGQASRPSQQQSCGVRRGKRHEGHLGSTRAAKNRERRRRRRKLNTR